MTFYELHDKISHFFDGIGYWFMNLEVEEVLLTIGIFGGIILIGWIIEGIKNSYNKKKIGNNRKTPPNSFRDRFYDSYDED